MNVIESVQATQTYRPMELASSADLPDLPERETQEPRAEEPVVSERDPKAVIQFSADQVSGEMRMRVVDPESGEVVRQIPPEEMVAISRMLGLLFDRVA